MRIVANYSPLADLFFNDRALGPGDSIQLAAEVYDTLGNLLPDHPLVWRTSDSAMATVTATGLVTGQDQAGDVGITVLATPLIGHGVAFYVRPHVATITPDTPQVSITTSASTVVTFVLRDSTGTDLGYRKLTFTTSDSAVALVAQFNFATEAQIVAVAPGTATIAAEREGRRGSLLVEVVTAPAPRTVVQHHLPVGAP
jgi:hypothetical protein